MFQDFFKLFSPTIDDIISEWRHNLNSISSYFSLHPKQPETIPQASINMSDVIEVADAEQITGHINSILIQTPDRSTFVKGTCQEESKWWYNVLVQLVKSKVRHHKRNAFLKGQNQKCKLRSLILVFALIDQCLGREWLTAEGNCVGIEWHNRMFAASWILSTMKSRERASGGWRSSEFENVSVTFDGNAKRDPVSLRSHSISQPSLHTVRLAIAQHIGCRFMCQRCNIKISKIQIRSKRCFSAPCKTIRWARRIRKLPLIRLNTNSDCCSREKLEWTTWSWDNLRWFCKRLLMQLSCEFNWVEMERFWYVFDFCWWSLMISISRMIISLIMAAKKMMQFRKYLV